MHFMYSRNLQSGCGLSTRFIFRLIFLGTEFLTNIFHNLIPIEETEMASFVQKLESTALKTVLEMVNSTHVIIKFALSKEMKEKIAFLVLPSLENLM